MCESEGVVVPIGLLVSVARPFYPNASRRKCLVSACISSCSPVP